jgi:FkbM family methyltransferase
VAPDAKVWLSQRVARHPSASRRTAGVAGALGVWSLADRLRNATHSELPVKIELPEHLPSHGKGFLMFPCGARDLVVSKLVLGWHEFERPMPDVFTAAVSALGGTLLDVGANTGFYSLLATTVNRQCTAVAFEPFAPVSQLLTDNIALNHLGSRVRVVQWAVSDETGIAELFIPDQEHGLIESSCSLNRSFKELRSGSVQVRVTTIDEFVRTVPRARPSVIKIDVESLEHAVLRGARRTLARHRPLVFFEVLHIGDPEAIDRMRGELDYVDVRLAPGQLVIGERVQHDPDAWNHLLVPAERLDEVLEIVHVVGLAVR